MHCTNCGQQISFGDNFCISCNAKVGASSATTDAKPAGFAKKLLADKRKLIAGGGALVLIVAALVVFLPKSVAVSISIDAKYGGVFNDNCELTSYAAAVLDDKLTVTPKGSGEDIVAPIEWSTDHGDCVGLAKVSVSPFSEYTLFVGSKEIGSIRSGEAWGGAAEGSAKVKITHALSTSLSLVFQEDYCSGDANASWNCTGGFGLHTDSANSLCYGEWGYNDIVKGARITITGKSSGSVATGVMDAGHTWSLDSTSSGKVTCILKSDAPIEVNHDDEGYYVEIANRGQVLYTNEGLELNGWTADMHLGD